MTKLVVIYPHPRDVAAFKHVYETEHVPLAAAKPAMVGYQQAIV